MASATKKGGNQRLTLGPKESHPCHHVFEPFSRDCGTISPPASAPKPSRKPVALPDIAGAIAPQSRHDGLSLLAPSPSRQHRLPARRPLRDLEVLGVGLLPSAKATASGRLSKTPGADHREVAADDPDFIPLAGTAPSLDCRWVELLDVRCRGIAARVRPTGRATTRMRFPRGQVPGTGRRGHRDDLAGHDRPLASPRVVPRRPSPRRATSRRRPDGRPRLLLVRPPGIARPEGRPRGFPDASTNYC